MYINYIGIFTDNIRLTITEKLTYFINLSHIYAYLSSYSFQNTTNWDTPIINMLKYY